VLAEIDRTSAGSDACDPASRLLEAMGRRGQSPDGLARRAGLSEEDARAQLVLLELAGAIERRPGGRYGRRREKEDR
jgi:predicted Rossmann fold nucleotide-binding protein DprA/Smf involved in DNA uptake